VLKAIVSPALAVVSSTPMPIFVSAATKTAGVDLSKMTESAKS
jgi:hypothetical protein